MAFTGATNQQLLDKYFGKGAVQAGGGRGDAAVAAAPQAVRDAYIADRRAAGDTGYTIAASTPQASYNGGVVPVGQIEPLNQWQKTALTTQQGGYQDPGFGGSIFSALQGQQGAANNIQSSMTPEVFQQLYKQYQNPYQQDVINNTNSDIQRNSDILKNRTKERFAGSNSFGSTAQGVENGQIDDATLRAIAANTAGLNSAGYQSAVSNALNNNQQNYNQSLGKFSAFGNLLNSSIAGQQQGQNNFSQNVNNGLSAGNTVQNQNQNLLNVVQGQIGGVQQYPYSQLSNFASLLAPFSASQQQQYQYNPSSASKFGSALSGLGTIAGSQGAQNTFSSLFGGGGTGALGLTSGFLGSA